MKQLKQLRKALPRLKELLYPIDYETLEDLEKIFSEDVSPNIIEDVLNHKIPSLHGTLHKTDAYFGKTEAILEFQKAICLVYEIATANELKPFPQLNYIFPPDPDYN